MDLVVTKANIYMNSETVKGIKAKRIREGIHYGIAYGTILGFNNLVSLILYTDFSDLCRDMSSTFRKISEYETLSSLKARNSQYYWLSRLLRETVECFGYGPSPKTSFYTGISLVMAVPSFRIRLCAPISTSTHIEVAVKFSGRNGMILELKTGGEGGYTNYLTTFNCQWISRYKEESERYEM